MLNTDTSIAPRDKVRLSDLGYLGWTWGMYPWMLGRGWNEPQMLLLDKEEALQFYILNQCLMYSISLVGPGSKTYDNCAVVCLHV